MSTGLLSAADRAVSGGFLWFRLARIFFLCLIVVMPWEAVTAAREIALAGGAFMLLLHLWVHGPRRFRRTVLFWPWLLYAACAAFSLLSAVDLAYSLGELRAEVLKGALVFYTAVHFVRHEEHLRQSYAALLVGAGVMAVSAVVFFGLEGGDLLTHQVRAGGLHNGYGGLATYLVTVWPFVLLAPRVWPERRLRVVWGLLVALSAVCGYITYSRAAWVAMLVETGLCLVIVSRRRLRAAVVGGVLCLAVLSASWLVPGAHHGENWRRLWRDPAGVGGTAGDLIALWRHSLGEIARHPFTGIGLGRHSFSKAYPRFRATHQPLLWHSHNMFIELALEMGLQGLAAILWAFVLLVWVLWPKAPPERGAVGDNFAAAAAVMVIGFSLRNLTDDFFVNDSALLLWLLAGLALAGRDWRREAD